MEKLKILIADDHALLRDGLKALVNEQPDMEVVGEADNGKTALEQAKKLQPDIILMDISMPEVNGNEPYFDSDAYLAQVRNKIETYYY